MSYVRGLTFPVLIMALVVIAGGSTLAAVAPAAADTAPDPTSGAAFDIPITMYPDGHGGFVATTEVSINGSSPIRVGLDTGTSYLVINPGAIVDPTTPLSYPDPAITFEMFYDGSGVDGQVASGTVSVLDAADGVVATTPGVVAFVDGVTCDSSGGCPDWGGVIDGVWGLGPELSAPDEGSVFSPIMQFGSPSDAGFTMDYTADVPRITVGPVDAPPNVTRIAREKTGEVKPNGQPGYTDPEMCWTISVGAAVASGCLVTRIDSGQALGFVTGTQFDPVMTPQNDPPQAGSGTIRTGMVPPGALVTWSVPGQIEPFAGITAQDEAPNYWGQYVESGGALMSNYNTGQNFYKLHVVAYDNTDGLVYVSPTSNRPAAPTVTGFTPGPEGLTAGWVPSGTAEPQAAATGWVVSVTDPTGAVIERATVAVDARTATVPGLSAGTRYSVSVAALSDVGLGVWSTPVAAEYLLPATGAAPIAWWPAAVVSAVGLVLILWGRRHRLPGGRGSRLRRGAGCSASSP